MNDGILSAIGGTPLVRLHHVHDALDVRLYAKLELMNPAGSMKDRAGLNMLRSALEAGVIKPGWTIVESTSGNMGIGLAQACAMLDLRFVAVVDTDMNAATTATIVAYGGEIDLVSDPRGTTFLQARLVRVAELVRIGPNAWWPNQYANLDNASAHRKSMREICEALGAAPDYLLSPVGTCGTLRGMSEFVRENGLQTRVIAVDAIGSVIFSDNQPQVTRLIPGHGSSRRPELCVPGIAHSVVQTSDYDCVVGCRRLARREAILAGGSGGAIITAVDRLRGHFKPGSTVVAVLCDRGERYLETIFSDVWVMKHFGAVPVIAPRARPAAVRAAASATAVAAVSGAGAATLA